MNMAMILKFIFSSKINKIILIHYNFFNSKRIMEKILKMKRKKNLKSNKKHKKNNRLIIKIMMIKTSKMVLHQHIILYF